MVSEPSDADNQDCEDIGYAQVDIREIMEENRNLNDEKINSENQRLLTYSRVCSRELDHFLFK